MGERTKQQQTTDENIALLINDALVNNKKYILLSEEEGAYLIVIPRKDDDTKVHTSLHIGSIEDLEIIFEKATNAETDLEIDDFLTATRLQSDILFIKDEMVNKELDEAIILFDTEIGYTPEEALMVIKFIIATAQSSDNMTVYRELMDYYQNK